MCAFFFHWILAWQSIVRDLSLLKIHCKLHLCLDSPKMNDNEIFVCLKTFSCLIGSVFSVYVFWQVSNDNISWFQSNFFISTSYLLLCLECLVGTQTEHFLVCSVQPVSDMKKDRRSLVPIAIFVLARREYMCLYYAECHKSYTIVE